MQGNLGDIFFPDSLDLLSCDLLIELKDEEQEYLEVDELDCIDAEVKPIFFNQKNLAFASCNYDGFLLIDFDPAPLGKRGQIIYQDMEQGILKVIAPSFEDLLQTYHDDLDSGKFIYDENYCSIALASGKGWITL